MNTPTNDPLATVIPTIRSTADLAPVAGHEPDSSAVEAATTAFLEMAHAGVSTSVLADTFGLDEATVRDLLGRRDIQAPGKAA